MDLPEAILFDLDGVLIDTEPLLANAWRETAKEHNHILTHDNLEELRGIRKIDCAKKVFEWINKAITIEELVSTQTLKLSKQLNKAKPFKGAEELIRFCIKINLPIALVTSSSSHSFEIKSSIHPWLDLFHIKILGDDKFISAGKPYPDPYLRAIEILDVNPEKTLVIEDSYLGSLAGLRAGCNLCLFSKDIKIFNNLINQFNQNKIQRINGLDEIIYYLKLIQGF